jgi:gliding motility-associated-like protein
MWSLITDPLQDQFNITNMRWLVYILLPLQLFAQETYTNCEGIAPQNYQVSYDVDKVYYWDIIGGEILYNNNNSITVQWPDSVGTYIISVYTTRFGCDGDTSYHEVIVEDCPYLQIFVPNSFTPNQDDYNETFYVHGADKDDIELMVIYNRWGEVIYQTTDNIPWDGKNCQVGVYTYSIRTHNQHYTGHVTLIR